MAQWNKKDQAFPSNNDKLFETVTLADNFGAISDWRPNFTSKNRLKVSNPQTVFWSTWGRDTENDTFASERTGTGVEYISNDAADPVAFDPQNPGSDIITEKSIVLRVSTAGDRVVRQSTRVVPYIPGKEQFLTMAVRFDTPSAGIRRRIGLFDEDNGAFFEDGGDNYYCCIRKNGVETVRVPREQWNGDKLDGTGRSQIVADPTKQQLIGIEYEWYGTGKVEFGYTIDGEHHVIHTVYNANQTVGTWTNTPYLPIRFELEALPGYAGGDAYMYQASTSVVAEGGIESLGVVHNTISGLSTSTNPPTISEDFDLGSSGNTFKPILSMRLNDLQLGAFASPVKLQVATTDNTNLYYALVKNATLTGANFTLGEQRAVEIDLAASALNFDSDAVLFSGFSFGGNSAPIDLPTFSAQFQLGRKFTNPGSPDFTSLTSDVITLAVAGGANKTAVASLTWIEQP